MNPARALLVVLASGDPSLEITQNARRELNKFDIRAASYPAQRAEMAAAFSRSLEEA